MTKIVASIGNTRRSPVIYWCDPYWTVSNYFRISFIYFENEP